MSQSTIERDAMYYATRAQKAMMKHLAKTRGELVIMGYSTANGLLYLSTMSGTAINIDADGIVQ